MKKIKKMSIKGIPISLVNKKVNNFFMSNFDSLMEKFDIGDRVIVEFSEIGKKPSTKRMRRHSVIIEKYKHIIVVEFACGVRMAVNKADLFTNHIVVEKRNHIEATKKIQYI